MSLLNDMLRDLAKQQFTTSSLPMVGIMPKVGFKYRYKILLQALIVLLLAVFMGLFYLKKDQTSLVQGLGSASSEKALSELHMKQLNILPLQNKEMAPDKEDLKIKPQSFTALMKPLVLENNALVRSALHAAKKVKDFSIQVANLPQDNAEDKDSAEDKSSPEDNDNPEDKDSIESLTFKENTFETQASEQDMLTDWVEGQSEALAPVVNKVYSEPTLEEWHEIKFNQALRAIDKGLDDKAIGILQEILIKMPKSSEVRESLASLYMAYGDYALASSVVAEGLNYNAKDIPLLTIKARLLLHHDKTEEAIALLSSYQPSLSHYPDFYGTLAAALQSKGESVKAGSLYSNLLKKDPHNGQYWLGYAISLENTKQSQQAISAYLRASNDANSEQSVRDYAQNRLKILQG